MADNDRIVYPDEVEQAKEAASKGPPPESGDSNSVEETPQTPVIMSRNMIQVPDNCPPGYKLVNGVCREVFD